VLPYCSRQADALDSRAEGFSNAEREHLQWQIDEAAAAAVIAHQQPTVGACSCPVAALGREAVIMFTAGAAHQLTPPLLAHSSCSCGSCVLPVGLVSIGCFAGTTDAYRSKKRAGGALPHLWFHGPTLLQLLNGLAISSGGALAVTAMAGVLIGHAEQHGVKRDRLERQLGAALQVFQLAADDRATLPETLIGPDYP